MSDHGKSTSACYVIWGKIYYSGGKLYMEYFKLRNNLNYTTVNNPKYITSAVSKTELVNFEPIVVRLFSVKIGSLEKCASTWTGYACASAPIDFQVDFMCTQAYSRSQASPHVTFGPQNLKAKLNSLPNIWIFSHYPRSTYARAPS